MKETVANGPCRSPQAPMSIRTPQVHQLPAPVRGVRGASILRRLALPLLLAVLWTGMPTASGAQQMIRGDADAGRALAELWCSACHLVSPAQPTATPDVPSFADIASRSAEDLDALAGFLADPHPPMTDLSLTRTEIRDLVAYFSSLK
jgi:mono/diheme cytochrome c family protein